MRQLLTAVFLGSAIASTALCDSGDFQWQGQLAPGQLIEILGIHGSIHAVGTQAGSSEPAQVKIQAVPFEGGVVICAVYPNGDTGKQNVCAAPGMDTYLGIDQGDDVVVDFTVQVPAGVRLRASTLTGEISATSLTGEVNANVVHGAVTISTSKGAVGTTLQGPASISMGEVAWNGARMLVSGDGDLDVQLPSDANINVSAFAFHGAVISDFPLALMSAGSFTEASGTLGTGGRSLRLSSRNGNITLRQGPPSGN
jgi:hypothetical protein